MVADRGVGKRTEVVSLYRSFVWTRNYFDQRILELLCFLSTTSHFSGFLLYIVAEPVCSGGRADKHS